jgi:hypothetical protein
VQSKDNLKNKYGTNFRMEPAYVIPIDLNEEDHDVLDRNDELEEINAETQTAIQELKTAIFKFKNQLYTNEVVNDKDHKASDLGSMMSFHALFLQSVAYWIGLLDNSPVPIPKFDVKKDQKDFEKLSKGIEMVAKTNSDARTLVYSLLFLFSTQHPFELGKNLE